MLKTLITVELRNRTQGEKIRLYELRTSGNQQVRFVKPQLIGMVKIKSCMQNDYIKRKLQLLIGSNRR